MHLSNYSAAAWALPLLVGALWLPRSAWADDDKQSCIRAHSESQHLRLEGKLRAARDKAVLCSRELCPTVIRKECSEWLPEVDRLLPSVVVIAKEDQGKEVVEVALFVDGDKVASELDGKAIVLDPGRHTFRLERSGLAPVEEVVILREGEKARSLVFHFKPTGKKPATTSDTPEPPDTASKEPSPGAPGPPVAAYLLGGLGVVALGSFAYFGLKGRSDESALRDRDCSPYCPKSETDAVQKKYLIADISLGLGLVSLGVATYLFLSKPSSPTPAQTGRWRFDLSPTSSGGTAQLAGSF